MVDRLLAMLFLVASIHPQEEDELYDPWADNCEDMDPGNSSSTEAMPYRLALSADTINYNQGVYFTITAPESMALKGFMVQARDDKMGDAVGQFDTQFDNVDVINCFGRSKNTAIHADFSPKTHVRMRWALDTEEEGSVTFYATVAQEVEPELVYWVSQKAATVYIKKPSLQISD